MLLYKLSNNSLVFAVSVLVKKIFTKNSSDLHYFLTDFRAYAYLILSSQASARSSINENTASALTAQSAFLNNFENVVNRRVDIREDIKGCQDTLSYTSSKVDYSVGENIYMLPSDMNLKIKTGTIGTIIKFSFPMLTLVWGKTKMLT